MMVIGIEYHQLTPIIFKYPPEENAAYVILPVLIIIPFMMAVEYSHHPQWLPKLMAGMKQPSIYMVGYGIALLTLKTIIVSH